MTPRTQARLQLCRGNRGGGETATQGDHSGSLKNITAPKSFSTDVFIDDIWKRREKIGHDECCHKTYLRRSTPTTDAFHRQSQTLYGEVFVARISSSVVV